MIKLIEFSFWNRSIELVRSWTTQFYFRRLAIFTYLSKVLEIFMRRQLNNVILFCEKQSGFRPNHSCDTFFIRENTSSHYLSSLEGSDIVNNNTLNHKLKNLFKFSSPSITLLPSYLTGRTIKSVSWLTC